MNSAASPSVEAATAVDSDRAAASDSRSKALPFRIGHGFDLHRLEPGYPLIIGGINIPHDRGCEAHSDGNFFASSLFSCFRVLVGCCSAEELGNLLTNLIVCILIL